jgi:hypothetical protein
MAVWHNSEYAGSLRLCRPTHDFFEGCGGFEDATVLFHGPAVLGRRGAEDSTYALDSLVGCGRM